jgi:hypothetical protein
MLQALYPLTGTIVIVGLGAVAYGLQGGSSLMILEGFFLAWVGFDLSLKILTHGSE